MGRRSRLMTDQNQAGEDIMWNIELNIGRFRINSEFPVLRIPGVRFSQLSSHRHSVATDHPEAA